MYPLSDCLSDSVQLWYIYPHTHQHTLICTWRLSYHRSSLSSSTLQLTTHIRTGGQTDRQTDRQSGGKMSIASSTPACVLFYYSDQPPVWQRQQATGIAFRWSTKREDQGTAGARRQARPGPATRTKVRAWSYTIVRPLFRRRCWRKRRRQSHTTT